MRAAQSEQKSKHLPKNDESGRYYLTVKSAFLKSTAAVPASPAKPRHHRQYHVRRDTRGEYHAAASPRTPPPVTKRLPPTASGDTTPFSMAPSTGTPSTGAHFIIQPLIRILGTGRGRKEQFRISRDQHIPTTASPPRVLERRSGTSKQLRHRRLEVVPQARHPDRAGNLGDHVFEGCTGADKHVEPLDYH